MPNNDLNPELIAQLRQNMQAELERYDDLVEEQIFNPNQTFPLWNAMNEQQRKEEAARQIHLAGRQYEYKLYKWIVEEMPELFHRRAEPPVDVQDVDFDDS